MKKIFAVLALLVIMSTPVFAVEYGQGGSPIGYTVYCQMSVYNQDCLYTTDVNEYQTWLSSDIWYSKGAFWKSPLEGDGQPVYRLYHPIAQQHLYTLDQNEVNVLTSQYGWQADNNGNALFYSGGSYPIYRFYDPRTGGHYLTPDKNDVDTMPFPVYEGIAMYAIDFVHK